jgi:uncharacterized damage-inducible protein DinB
MNTTNACCHILSQLTDMTTQLSDSDFTKPVESLANSSVGQHLRHTLEFFICLKQGVEQGTVNYDKRLHDKLIETDRTIALGAIASITEFVQSRPENKSLRLEVGYDLNSEEYASVDTNVLRELVYNIEHAVHHMAFMKIGIREAAPYVKLPFDFGIAASTIRHQESSTVSH